MSKSETNPNDRNANAPNGREPALFPTSGFPTFEFVSDFVLRISNFSALLIRLRNVG